MKERPILFSGPMVRALLDGTKTQTRRVVKPALVAEIDSTHDDPFNILHRCPYGAPGDRLWVRETWGEFVRRRGHAVYRATAPHALGSSNPWRPSIHMPRWASRITLTITDVRVERLQDISEDDAKAEGVATWRDGWTQKEQAEAFLQGTTARLACGDDSGTAQRLYYLLWQSINAARGYGWDANPWVWVITFATVPGGR